MEKLLLTYATRPFSMRIAQLLTGHFEVVSATSDEIPTLFRERYYTIPKGVNPIYAHEVLKVALDLNCTYVLPLGLDEIRTLSESLILFEEYGIMVLCPPMSDLKELDIIANPAKDIPLSLLIGNRDLFSGERTEWPFDGLGIIADSGESFMLTVVQ